MKRLNPEVGKTYTDINGFKYICREILNDGSAVLERAVDGKKLAAYGAYQFDNGTIKWGYSIRMGWAKPPMTKEEFRTKLNLAHREIIRLEHDLTEERENCRCLLESMEELEEEESHNLSTQNELSKAISSVIYDCLEQGVMGSGADLKIKSENYEITVGAEWQDYEQDKNYKIIVIYFVDHFGHRCFEYSLIETKTKRQERKSNETEKLCLSLRQAMDSRLLK